MKKLILLITIAASMTLWVSCKKEQTKSPINQSEIIESSAILPGGTVGGDNNLKNHFLYGKPVEGEGGTCTAKDLSICSIQVGGGPTLHDQVGFEAFNPATSKLK